MSDRTKLLINSIRTGQRVRLGAMSFEDFSNLLSELKDARTQQVHLLH